MVDIQPLSWDTAFFGYPVWKIVLSSGSHENVKDLGVVLQAHGNKFELIYIYVRELNGSVRNAIEILGGRFVGARISYEICPEYCCNEAISPEISRCDALTAGITELALQSGVYSRFHRDPGFKRNEYARLYERWIQKSFENVGQTTVLVYGLAEEPKGFITLEKDGTNATIGLLAVDGKSRRKGIGKSLLKAAVAICLHEKIRKLSIATQFENLPACCLYQSVGFEKKESIWIFHLWNDAYRKVAFNVALPAFAWEKR